MINENSGFAHCGERAIIAQHDVGNVIIIAEAGEHHVLVRSSFCRSRSDGDCHGFVRQFRLPCLCTGEGAIVSGDAVASAGEVSGHRRAHHAKAQECNICHGLRDCRVRGQDAMRQKTKFVRG